MDSRLAESAKDLYGLEEDGSKRGFPLLSLYFLVPLKDTWVLQSWGGSKSSLGSWVGSENLLAVQRSVDTDATEPFAGLLLLLGN